MGVFTGSRRNSAIIHWPAQFPKNHNSCSSGKAAGTAAAVHGKMRPARRIPKDPAAPGEIPTRIATKDARPCWRNRFAKKNVKSIGQWARKQEYQLLPPVCADMPE